MSLGNFGAGGLSPRRQGKGRYVELVLYKAYADLRAEASRTYISFLWWALEPMLYLAGFYFVFAVLLERRTPNFVAFLLVGLVTWKWFASSVLHASGSILNNPGLMRQVYLPKAVFPFVTITTDSVKFLLVFTILLVFLLWNGGTVSPAWLALPLLLVVELVFLSGVACLAAAVVPIVPDLRILLENVLLVMMFVSGIFFDPATIPEPYQAYFYLNPMATLIESFRAVLLRGEWPAVSAMLGITAVGIALCAIASFILHRLDRAYPRWSNQ